VSRLDDDAARHVGPSETLLEPLHHHGTLGTWQGKDCLDDLVDLPAHASNANGDPCQPHLAGR